jgi:Secretion system C-terminal sorting domain/Ig-like domain CHU_C associated
MRKLLFSILSLMCIAQYALAQPATFSNPLGIGRNNCSGAGGVDSLYYFNYTSPNLTNSVTPITACRPVLRTNFAPLSGYAATSKPFVIFNASIAFNPADQMIYYVWTDYNIPAPYKSYIWRWSPNACPMPAAPGLDTFRTFNTDIGGITFDANGTAWQLEFIGPAPYKGMLRQVNFTTGTVGIPDTLDYTGGKQLWNVGTGDITLTPSGQMYFVFNNKLFTPDYGSAGGPTKHIKCTYIDTVRLPSGKTGLPGLAFGSGDLIASYTPGTGCVFKRIDPITGDTAGINYTYPASKGVYATDMTQINSGVGASKRLISVTATGTPGQYDVVYEVYVRNYGSVAITNVQLTDDLTAIRGAAFLSNVSATLISNPAGVAINPLFNGNSNINLLAAGQTLPCYPVANNNFTVRINCRLSSLVSGTVYNNSAIITGNGFKSVALRDSSTNGANPDLNQNDKPDDLGEGQPTPLLIILTPITPPCATLDTTLYNQDFGSGTGLNNNIPPSVAVPSATSTYIGTAAAPMPVNRFTVTNNASLGDASNWISLTDHTGNLNGRMLVVNADASANIMYRDTLPVSCAGQQYSVSFWAAFIGNSAYQTVCDGLGGFKFPRILCRVRDLATGLVITQYTSDTINVTSWRQHGMRWVMPAGYTQVILELVNAAPGGCGNDVALDDIRYGICDPIPTVSINNPAGTCIGSSVTFTANISDNSVIPGPKDYQWQWSPAPGNGPWTNIATATTSTYVINPVAAADTGRYYRVIIAAQGNIGVITCQYISPGARLAGLAPSVAAASATRNKNNICPGIPVTLGITGGTLGTNAVWRWYSSSCASTLVGTGSTLIVTPAVTTTYYVRAEGDCNNTTCQQIVVNVVCDIDKDNDGIPDFVESNLASAFGDANSNGIINAYDPLTAGYVDYNNDFVNDNYQADGDVNNNGVLNYLDPTFPGRVDTNLDGIDDRFDKDLDGRINMLDLDSDNDGIPDAVEAYGVDVNGDGLIDNYVDIDADGLSDNVDANLSAPLSGAQNTGLGLGLQNFDGDNLPNFLDLDSDNDGIPDVVEVQGPYTTNNGLINGFVDVNGDGLHDSYINATGLLRTGADLTADGRADSWPNKNIDRDLRPNPYDLDADGDGIADVIEAALPDANYNGLADGTIGSHGWSQTVDAMPSLPNRNSDANGNPDYLDIDSDNDGIPDNIEGQSTSGYMLPSLTDTDGDGIVDTYDNTPATYGGAGIFVYDHDGDGTPDYRDLDTDADGQPDIVEGNDFNLNDLADDLVTLTGLDTDGDGLDNRFDSLNSVTNVKGTSYMMGTGGTFTGDATPGTRSTVQSKTPAQVDRDWRFVGNILPVQFLGLTGLLQSDQATLSWTVIASKDVDRFEVERSTDNYTYNKVGDVSQPVKLNESQSFSFVDNVTGVNKEIIYYRIKVVGRNGEIQYSNIVIIRRHPSKTDLTVMPNPARDRVSIAFFAERESAITIRLVDNLGKIVVLESRKAAKGNNTLQLTGLSKYSNGVYMLQVLVNNEIVTNKIILTK